MRTFVLSLLVLAFVGAAAASPRMMLIEEYTNTG
jgi:hypothetical protein